jgi:hypothetical protein
MTTYTRFGNYLRSTAIFWIVTDEGLPRNLMVRAIQNSEFICLAAHLDEALRSLAKPALRRT